MNKYNLNQIVGLKFDKYDHRLIKAKIISISLNQFTKKVSYTLVNTFDEHSSPEFRLLEEQIDKMIELYNEHIY
jgi:hypothetical protein